MQEQSWSSTVGRKGQRSKRACLLACLSADLSIKQQEQGNVREKLEEEKKKKKVPDKNGG